MSTLSATEQGATGAVNTAAHDATNTTSTGGPTIDTSAATTGNGVKGENDLVKSPETLTNNASTDSPTQQQQQQQMNSKDAQKLEKLMNKEAKNDQKTVDKSLKHTTKTEKDVRKAQKAERKSTKKHEDAIKLEHKAQKKFNKAKEQLEKAQAHMRKMVEELDIKKKHTIATQDSYKEAKSTLDKHQNKKLSGDRERSERQASLSAAKVQ